MWWRKECHLQKSFGNETNISTGTSTWVILTNAKKKNNVFIYECRKITVLMQKLTEDASVHCAWNYTELNTSLMRVPEYTNK